MPRNVIYYICLFNKSDSESKTRTLIELAADGIRGLTKGTGGLGKDGSFRATWSLYLNSAAVS